jgi:hypothetical protein
MERRTWRARDREAVTVAAIDLPAWRDRMADAEAVRANKRPTWRTRDREAVTVAAIYRPA